MTACTAQITFNFFFRSLHMTLKHSVSLPVYCLLPSPSIHQPRQSPTPLHPTLNYILHKDIPCLLWTASIRATSKWHFKLTLLPSLACWAHPLISKQKAQASTICTRESPAYFQMLWGWFMSCFQFSLLIKLSNPFAISPPETVILMTSLTLSQGWTHAFLFIPQITTDTKLFG